MFEFDLKISLWDLFVIQKYLLQMVLLTSSANCLPNIGKSGSGLQEFDRMDTYANSKTLPFKATI